MKSSFDEFKELVLAHAVERSPHTTGIFELDDVPKIVEYMLNSYFRHFGLYRYIFTKKLEVTLVQVLPHGVEDPLMPRPLGEALPQVRHQSN
jgi:hypothetical protein